MEVEFEIIGKGKRSGEYIIAKKNGSSIEWVASGFIGKGGWSYLLYPVNWGTCPTIKSKMSISIFKVKKDTMEAV